MGLARDTKSVFGVGANVAGTSSSDSSHSSGSYGSTPMGPYNPGMSRHGPHKVHPDYIAPRDGVTQWGSVFFLEEVGLGRHLCMATRAITMLRGRTQQSISITGIRAQSETVC